MSRRNMELNKLHRHFIGIVSERFQYIITVVNHPQPAGSKGQKRALHKNRHQYNEEGDMKYDFACFRSYYC